MSSPVNSTQFDFTKRSLPVSAQPTNRARKLYFAISLIAAVIFVFAGILMLPLLGLQSDEVMFVYDFWHPAETLYAFSWFHHPVMPAMMMSYLGALKCWIYAPLLKLAPLSVWTIRFPALILAAVTILLTGYLLRSIQGRTAAAIGVGLLATDVTFLVTAVFDWGPVVLQNLLLAAGILLTVKWYRERRELLLFAAGLVFGLALWNKALFLWNLSGLAIALLLIGMPELIRVWRWRVAAVFVAGLCVGAFPLIKFNLRQGGATLEQNSHLTLADVGSKASYLRRALNGREGTFALVDTTRKGIDHTPRPFESLSLSLANDVRPGPSLWRVEAGLLFIVAGLFAADKAIRRWILFFLISGLIGWFESAITVDAGASIHHTVLFWINWYCAVALGAAAIPRLRTRILKPVVAAVIAVLCFRGLFLVNLEYAHLISYDALTPWTDADRGLAAHLTLVGVARAITVDSGIAKPLNVRSNNQISMEEESFSLESGRFDRGKFENCRAPECLVVLHVPQRTTLSHVREVLDDSLRLARLEKTSQQVLSDTHGMPVYSSFYLRDGKREATSTREPGDVARADILDPHGPPALIADPGVIVADGPGETNLVWRAPATMIVEVHIGSPNGSLFAASRGSGSRRTGSWVSNGMLFFLQNRSNDRALTAENTLASVRVEVRSRR